MKKNKMYIIWSHPRRDSLTAQVVQEIQGESVRQGVNVSTLDLYRSGFDPVLREDDEPDWNNPQKTYSPEVHRLFGELEDKDTLVLVFPVWWYGFPAMLKGYLERVWNYGLAYGEGSALKHKKTRWLALVGGSQAGFIKFGWEKNMTDYIKGSMGYLGIEDANIDFLYNTIGVEEGIDDREGHYQQLFMQALGRESMEETGLIIKETPEWVWSREVVFERNGSQFISHERYYLVYVSSCESGEPNLSENEKSNLLQKRWWSIDEMLASEAAFRPVCLAQELHCILLNGILSSPKVIP